MDYEGFILLVLKVTLYSLVIFDYGLIALLVFSKESKKERTYWKYIFSLLWPITFLIDGGVYIYDRILAFIERHRNPSDHTVNK